MSAAYLVPEWPADPEAAALELLVRIPVDVLSLPVPHPLLDVLQDYAGVLQLEGAFAGLCWDDRGVTAKARPARSPSPQRCYEQPPRRFPRAHSPPAS